jgi:hypothetical protein
LKRKEVYRSNDNFSKAKIEAEKPHHRGMARNEERKLPPSSDTSHNPPTSYRKAIPISSRENEKP